MPKITDPKWKHKEDRATLICKECGEELDRSMFSPRGKTTAGKQKFDPRCKPCYRQFSKTFACNKQERTLREIADALKIRCEICGYDRFKGALDYHHRVPDEKQAEISDLIFHSSKLGTTEQMLIDEINKCAVLCCRCHREVHGGVTVLGPRQEFAGYK